MINLAENIDIVKKVQVKLWELLQWFVDICEKENLVYFLSFGTALGAYREHNFIPWDHDIDVDMPLQDFKKFIDICGKYADGTKYKLHYPGNEKDSNFTWGFISIAGTKIKFKNSISDEAKLGLDIFPFEKTVEAPAVYGLQRRILLNHREWLDSWEFDQQRRWEIKSCVMEMFKDVPGNKYWMSFDYTTQKTHIFRDDTIFPLQELEFNGRKMKCPHDINKYLSYLYGDDYMKPVVKEMWIENLEIDGEKLI